MASHHPVSSGTFRADEITDPRGGDSRQMAGLILMLEIITTICAIALVTALAVSEHKLLSALKVVVVWLWLVSASTGTFGLTILLGDA